MEKVIIFLIGNYLNILNAISPKMGGKQAFYIFCFPFKAKINKKQQAYLDTADQFKLPVDDFEIQCYRWGSGPRKILLVHGWQSNTYRWKKFIETLKMNEFSIYSFDAPGHGNSGSLFSNVPLYEKALSKIVDHIGNPESIISHSIGSFSTLYYMNENPQNVPLKMVSMASPNSANDFVKEYSRILNLSEKTMTNLSAYFQTYASKDISYFSLENLFEKNKTKGLIIHDKSDKVVTSDYAKKMHHLWPQSKLVITDGHGHKLNDDIIVRMVKEFVQ